MTPTARQTFDHQLSAARARLANGDTDHAVAGLIDTIQMLAPAPAISPPEEARGWLPGALVWRCRGCPQVLGLVVPAKDGQPARMMVKHFKRVIRVTSHDDFEQECDRCLAVNYWHGDGPDLTK